MFATRTVIVSMLTGTIVTLVASIVPALRATRVPPISAVREGSAATPAAGPARGLAALVIVAAGAGADRRSALFGGVLLGLTLVVGVLELFVGIAMLAPQLVKPLAAVVGLPAARLGGSAGRLARENAVRNPGRTASTAAALMIGLALVTVVATLGAGLRGSTEDGGQQAGQRRLRRDRQGRRRLVPGRVGQGAAGAASSRLGACARTPPRSRATSRRHRHRPEDDRALLHARLAEGSLAGLDDRGAIVSEVRGGHDLKLGTRSRAVLERQDARRCA